MTLRGSGGQTPDEARRHDGEGFEDTEFPEEEAETWEWLRIAAISGRDCARVFRSAGFDVELVGPEMLLVRRLGTPVARIPLPNYLGPVQLRTILHMAGMTPTMFALYLDDPEKQRDEG